MPEAAFERRGDAAVITPKADVDMSRSPELRQALREAFGCGARRVVVNLEHVQYMDSSGLATLVEAMRTSRSSKVSLVLCGLQSKVRSLFDLARLATFFDIRGSCDDALGGQSA